MVVPGGRWGPYRQASPRRPGTAPALGLRAAGAAPTVEQTIPSKEIPMWFRSRHRSPKDRPPVTSVRRSTACRLGVEPLEDRTVPSTFTVLNLNDGGAGSLRAEVAAAHANLDADLIRFADGRRGTLSLASQLSITEDLAIDGPSASSITVSGGGTTRVFRLSGGTTDVTLVGLTVAHGLAGRGAGIDHAGGSLAVSDCVFSDNWAVGGTGVTALGGGIFNGAGSTLAVRDTTFTGNQAVGGDGGGGAGGYGVGAAIENQGTATVEHSTFAGNLARGGPGTSGGSGVDGFGIGGAISNKHAGTLFVRASTFTGNQAIGGNRQAGSGPNDGVGTGGAISNGAPFEFLTSSLVIMDSTLTENGAFGGDGASGVDGGLAAGGAIANAFSSTAQVIRCVMNFNQAVAGDGGDGANGNNAVGGATFSQFGGASVAVS